MSLVQQKKKPGDDTRLYCIVFIYLESVCVVFQGMFSVQVRRTESNLVLQETAQLSVAT